MVLFVPRFSPDEWPIDDREPGVASFAGTAGHSGTYGLGGIVKIARSDSAKLGRMRAKSIPFPRAVLLTACVFGALSFILNSLPVDASGSTPTKAAETYNRSCEKTAQSQLAMDECAQSELDQVQSQLRSLLEKEFVRFGSNAVNQVQSQWKTFRDSECALEASPSKGGTIYPLIVGECEVQLTVERVQELKVFEQSLPH